MSALCVASCRNIATPLNRSQDGVRLALTEVLRRAGDQRHEAGDGAADLSKKDCHDRTDLVEERSKLRSPISETTNSLSVFDRVRSMLGIFSSGGRRVLETLWFESESQTSS